VIKKRVLFPLLMLFFLFSSTLWAIRNKIELPTQLKLEVEVLLNEGLVLHKNLVEDNLRQATKTMRRVLSQKKRVDKQLSKAKNTRPHLEKILNAIQVNMENALSEDAKNRDEYLKATFEQLVQILKVFKVTEYPVFFCSKNKTLWYQEDKRKPRTPVSHKLYKTCGHSIQI